MKIAIYALAFVLTLFGAHTLRADTVTYDFNGTLQSPVNGTTSITGTLTVDSATGNLTDYSIADGNFTYTPTTSSSDSIFFTGSEVDYHLITPVCTVVGSTCAFIHLDFLYGPNFSSLTFQTNSPNITSNACFATEITSLSAACGYLRDVAPFDAVVTASLFESGSATLLPEPSSLLLFTTGLLGLMVIGLRR